MNTELLRLYCHMGTDICEKQKSATWGDDWLKELSRKLMAEFPDMKGLSYRNLKYIRQWYMFYNERLTFGQQSVAQISENVSKLIPENIQSQLPTIELIDKLQSLNNGMKLHFFSFSDDWQNC